MSICRKVKIDFDYSIDNNILSRVTEFNDCGITITTKLSWCENVKTVSSKAHSMVGMIKRSVGFNSPIGVICRFSDFSVAFVSRQGGSLC